MEARLRLAAIVESSEDAILSMNLDGIVQSWNAAAERTSGITEAEIVGRPAAVLVPPELRETEEQRLLQRLRAGGRIQRHETIRLTKAGDRIDIALSMSPLTGSAGQLLGAAEVARDVTERNRATKALSSLSRRLIHAQEEERPRIARDLHDDIGQRVALLSVELSDLSSAEPGITPKRPGCRHWRPRSRPIFRRSRTGSTPRSWSCWGCRRPCNRSAGNSGSNRVLRSIFRAATCPATLPSEISLCLFRILQEALHNAAKHSGASHFSGAAVGFRSGDSARGQRSRERASTSMRPGAAGVSASSAWKSG